MKKLTALLAVLCLTFSFICPTVAHAGEISSPATQGSTTITATVPSYHSITVQPAAHAKIYHNGAFIDGSIDVRRHSDVLLWLAPSNGYKIKSLFINGVDVTSDIRNSYYKISKIYSDVEIQIETAIAPFVPPVPTPTPAATVAPTATPSPSVTPGATDTPGTQPAPTPVPGVAGTDAVIVGADGKPVTDPQQVQQAMQDVWQGWQDNRVLPPQGLIAPDGSIEYNGNSYNAEDLRYNIRARLLRDGKPMADVPIVIEGNGISMLTTTDSNGNFSFDNLLPGGHTLFVYHNGKPDYETRLHLIPHTQSTIIDIADGYIVAIPVDENTFRRDVHAETNRLLLEYQAQGFNHLWLLILLPVIWFIIAKKRKNKEE